MVSTSGKYVNEFENKKKNLQKQNMLSQLRVVLQDYICH